MSMILECAADAKLVPAADPWRQFIMVRGDSLRLLESISNIAGARRDPEANALIFQGDGAHFPELHGLSWAAACTLRRPDDVPADDLYPILRVLLDATPVPLSDAPRAEVEAWLRGGAR